MKHFFNTDLSNILNFFYFISNENKWKKTKNIKIQPNKTRNIFDTSVLVW